MYGFVRKALLFLVAVSVFSLPIAQADTGLRVGLASSDVTPPIGVPLAGYGGGARRYVPFDWKFKNKYAFFLVPSTGKHDPIRAKAMVVKHDGQKLVFISLDVVGATAQFHDQVVRALAHMGFQRDDIFLSATHTHSGPGTLSHEWLWEMLATDLYQDGIFKKFLAGIVSTVDQAMKAAEPAELYSTEFQAKGLQHNRRHANGPIDPRANTLWARSKKGAWLGGLINVAVHGTAMGTSNLLFSADVPGGLERALESRFREFDGGVVQPTVMFINGAEGDISPAKGGWNGIDELSEVFAQQAVDALPDAHSVPETWEVRHTTVPLGGPRLFPHGCVSDKFHKWINRGLAIGLGKALPNVAELWVIEWGDMKFMTWPGEPTTTVGNWVKDLAVKAGARQPWVLGLTNGYMGYFTTPDEFKGGGYEACSTMYGGSAARNITDEVAKLLQAE